MMIAWLLGCGCVFLGCTVVVFFLGWRDTEDALQAEKRRNEKLGNEVRTVNQRNRDLERELMLTNLKLSHALTTAAQMVQRVDDAAIEIRAGSHHRMLGTWSGCESHVEPEDEVAS